MTLLYMAMSWAAGIYLASVATLAGAAWPLPVVGGLALALLLRREVLPRRVGLCLIAAGLGLWRYESALPRLTDLDLATYNDRGWAEMTGVVIAEPEARDQNTRLRVSMETIRFGSRPDQPVHGLALVYADRFSAYAFGDRVRVAGVPQTPPEFDTFSFRDYLARSGIHTIVLRPQVQILAREQASPLLSALFALKAHAHGLILRLLPEPESSLLVGILLGNESGIAPEIRTAFDATNTTHLIAISGANVAVIVALLMSIFSRLTGKRASILLTLIGVGVYTVFVGAAASVVRAAIMASMSIIAQRVGRQNDGLTALAASAWLMTLLNPSALFDLGLILSVAATLGLVLYLGPMSRLVEGGIARLSSAQTARRIAAILADSVLITLAAQVTTLPIILLISGQFSPMSVVVNALVAPAQPWIMSLGILTVAAGTLWTPLGQFAAWLVSIPLAYTLAIIRAVAALIDTAAVDLSPNAVLVYYAALFGATALLTQPSRIRRRWLARLRRATPALMLSGATTAGLLWAMILSRPDGRLHIWFLAVGEGSAVLVQTPNGAHLLIDGGENPTRLLTALGDRLPFYRRDLDLLIISEPKPVTSDALPPLLSRYAVGAVLTNGQALAPPLAEALRESGAQVIPAVAGYRVESSDGVQIEVLNPAAAPPDGASADEAPLVLRLVYGEASFLLTSEVSEKGIRAVLSSGQYLRATVLQLPSNGAEKSNPPEWLAAVGPQVAVIIAEAGNRAAQPAERVLQQLEDLPVYRTDRQGTIHIATDGQQLWISTGR